MLKKLLRSAVGQAILSWLIARVIKFVGGSIRWETIRPEVRDRLVTGDLAPVVGVFWHNSAA